MSHGDRVTELPPGFVNVAQAPNSPMSVMADEKRKFYGTQFHLEVVHTPHGAAILRNFVRNIAGCKGDWTMRAFKDEAIAKIRAQVGKGRVICGLSGGVDSAVAAVLIHEAIGDQLTCVFVDHGLLRLAEGQKVVALFKGSYNIPLVHVDAAEDFPRCARRCRPIRKKSARSLASCSSMCLRRKRKRSPLTAARRQNFSPRARSIPT